MRVLLCVADLFRDSGGGQTVYREIVRRASGTTFTYLLDAELADAPRPANCAGVSLLPGRQLAVSSPLLFSPEHHNALAYADRIAHSVAGQAFDIVDVPDFLTVGSYLRDAFTHHGVAIGAIVLSMHGNISHSLSMNWGTMGQSVRHHQADESAQFRAVDGAYAISERYGRTWQGQFPRDVTVIDPASFVPLSMAAELVSHGAGVPTLVSIGRSERRKGDDLFIDLAAKVRAFEPAVVRHVGPDDHSLGHTSSSYVLGEFARRRAVPIDFLGPRTQSQLQALMAGRIMVVLPVRYDTLNLVALEAIAAGCPLAVSDAAGITDYLDTHLPDVPYVRMPLANLSAAVPEIVAVLRDYDGYRARVREAVLRHAGLFGIGYDITPVYAQVLARRQGVAPSVGSLGITYSTQMRVTRSAFRLVPPPFRPLVRSVVRRPLSIVRALRNDPRGVLQAGANRLGTVVRPAYLRLEYKAGVGPGRIDALPDIPETSREAVRAKLELVYRYASAGTYRGSFWREIARLERLLGNDMAAMAYDLRLLRLVADPDVVNLDVLDAALRARGFGAEADVAHLRYRAAEPDRAVRTYLAMHAAGLRRVSPVPAEIIEARRGVKSPRVSVIISLYNAAAKLPVFWSSLRLACPLMDNAVEVVFVDSASPADERSVIHGLAETDDVDVTYIRSTERETIQAAWNRGILASRAPYLVFLGADETLFPHALKVLADHLDAHPATDWVMANSIVTEVEESGLHKGDVMVYDRSGATKHDVLLETCYLSWVGGMYRKSIHDRFGYYDQTFGAAGDTEFKNRILPHISVDFLDQPLGVFLNYPEGQTTASPRAEIEDSRAWYLHRTPAGAAWALDGEPVPVVEALLRRSLWYRKSYRTDFSTDIEYSAILASHLRAREPGVARYVALASELARVVHLMRSLEVAPPGITRADAVGRVALTLGELWQAEQRLRRQFDLKDLRLDVLNDNRYEQHSWLWKTSNV